MTVENGCYANWEYSEASNQMRNKKVSVVQDPQLNWSSHEMGLVALFVHGKAAELEPLVVAALQ